MNISSVKDCTGCMACADRCPHSCIRLRKDRLGHIYPHVETDQCTDCGACLRVCPASGKPMLHAPRRVVAAWRTDDTQRARSSSGGLAAVLAERTIVRRGTVYGCAFVPPFSFRHVRCTTLKELDALRGSKYVQSDMTGVYRQIATDLKSGREVLFIGTPCQVAGIRGYFRSAPTLHTIDLVCHGVPPARLLRESLPDNITQLGVDRVEFRACTKFHFSAKSGISTVFSRPLNRDLYLKGFFTALYYRSSCYSCQFSRTERTGDVTLGDFWGVELPLPAGETDQGISLCLVNTLAGEEMMADITEQTIQHERLLSEAVAGNRQLSHPMPLTWRARLFRRLYPRLGFQWSVRLCLPEIIAKNYLFNLLHRS